MTPLNKIGTLLYKLSRNNSLHKRTLTMLRLKPLTYTKRILKQYATLHSKFNSWCNENASTINLKCNEVFTKGLPKNIKDFANKRQVKHTSTVLEPSIPFHTLVKLVDAEDIANDKIRTHDLPLEVNNITKLLHTQTLESSSQEQLMSFQPTDPNNKKKTCIKK